GPAPHRRPGRHRRLRRARAAVRSVRHARGGRRRGRVRRVRPRALAVRRVHPRRRRPGPRVLAPPPAAARRACDRARSLLRSCPGGLLGKRDPRGSARLSDATDESTRSLAVTSSDHPAPTERIEVTLGETVGRYQVRRLLGRGGMGQVYLARDVVLGRSVALKVVGPKGRGFSTERFLHEARAIARLNHPHVVQLYDFGEYKGGLYLALEYVEGDTLRERAQHGALGLDEALRHARAIADGLAHAHASGVYHCDLKPSNVMVGK